MIDKVLQRLCQEWLGLPVHGGALVPGSWRWDWKEGDPPIYPVHFTPPSRYFFQPQPGEDVRRYGERHAAALVAAIEGFIEPHLAQGTVPTVPGGVTEARLAKAILEDLREKKEDKATMARTFAGVLMGFLPTLDANLRLVLNEWLREATSPMWDMPGDSHLREMLMVLGLESLLDAPADAPAEIRELAERREQARSARDFAAADALRDELGERGWEVRDVAGGFELLPL